MKRLSTLRQKPTATLSQSQALSEDMTRYLQGEWPLALRKNADNTLLVRANAWANHLLKLCADCTPLERAAIIEAVACVWQAQRKLTVADDVLLMALAWHLKHIHPSS